MRVYFPRMLYRGESRQDLAREYFDVYHPHDEGPPRLDGLRIVWNLGNPVGSDGWQPAQVQLIESLLPHIRQFVRVRQALVAADALSAGLAGLLDNSRVGVLHLDRGGRVLAANAPALDILRRGEGLSDRDGSPSPARGQGPCASSMVYHASYWSPSACFMAAASLGGRMAGAMHRRCRGRGGLPRAGSVRG